VHDQGGLSMICQFRAAAIPASQAWRPAFRRWRALDDFLKGVLGVPQGVTDNFPDRTAV
jgi:hypothetical protein